VPYDEYVGFSGSGTFSQSGGTNTISSDFEIGYNSTGKGAYSLGNSGLLWATAVTETVGSSGTGSFTQSGGTNSCNYFNLGYYSTGKGTYSFSGGYTSVTNNAGIGYSGTGYFTQTGGTNSVGYWLNIGTLASGVGTYSLSSNGYLAVNSVVNCQENVGAYGTGTFTQTS